tara:strand:+ start:5557 stop:6372 length:816 start_codon:yes stop_codon:yes gene_type:complete
MNNIKIIAEIGWNHLGNISLAKKMIKAAKKNGADYCKFQTWNEKNLKDGPWDTDGRRDIYKKAQLSEQNHYELKEYCKKEKIIFFTSIFNITDLHFLKKINKNIIKIPSHEINNIELIKLASKNFKKVLVSTGASKWREILKIKNSVKKRNIIFMHCVSAYPCDYKNINLPRMEYLRKLSKTVGYSGHLPDIEDAIAAMSLGAKYIEKHFTIDKKLPGRDNKFAILPSDLKKIHLFRNKFNMMSKFHGLDLQKKEIDIYKNYRGRWSKNEK